MAIDMIEQSEMGALTHSRLGNKCFIDDNYSNFLGLFGSGGSLHGHRYFDKQRASQVQSSGEWNIDPTKENDCDYLQERLGVLQNRIAQRLADANKRYRTESETTALRNYETDYKNRIAKLKCVEKKLEEDKAKEEKHNAEVLKQTALDTAQFSVPQVQGVSNTSKYIMLGVGGLVATIVIIAVLRR